MNPHSFGNHLILDFLGIPKSDLENPSGLQQSLTKSLESLKLTIENASFASFPTSSVCLYTFILCCGHCKAHLNLKQVALNVELFLWGEASMEKLRKAEVAFCGLFGWDNCVTSILLQRGGVTQFFLNDTTHTGTIFKKFKFLHRERSPIHEIRVYDTEELGRALIIDGFIQFTQDKKDTFVSAMTKNAILAEKNYENVLVIGATDLALVGSLVKEQKNVKNVVMVEAEAKVLEVLEKYFDFGASFKDQKNFKVENKGVNEFIKEEKRKFDAVFIDLCDVEGKDWFSAEFFKNLKAITAEGGVITQKLQDVNSIQEYQKRVTEGGLNWVGNEFCEVPDHNTRFGILKFKN